MQQVNVRAHTHISERSALERPVAGRPQVDGQVDAQAMDRAPSTRCPEIFFFSIDVRQARVRHGTCKFDEKQKRNL